MVPTLRSITWVGVLAMGGLLGIGTSPVQAQNYAYPSRGYAYPLQRYYYPAPAYYYPVQRRADPAQGDPRPGGSYYYDRNGVERDARYPHWSFDYNLWLTHSL